MIPAAFEYAAPQSPQEALELLSSNECAEILAGGHTLLTALKQRKRRVSLLVDIADVGLNYIEIDDAGNLIVGAGANQAALSSYCEENGWPLLAEIGLKSGDPMVRARGTFVGALCAVEPGGDWVAAALALDTKVKILTLDGEQVLSLDDYIEGSRLRPHLVIEAIVPASFRHVPQGYEKVKHAAIGWSVASIAHVKTDRMIQFAASGAIKRPQRLPSISQERLMQLGNEELHAVIEAKVTDLPFHGDRYAPADWRRKRLALLIRDILISYTNKDIK